VFLECTALFLKIKTKELTKHCGNDDYNSDDDN
jgi:hypothetical protein